MNARLLTLGGRLVIGVTAAWTLGACAEDPASPGSSPVPLTANAALTPKGGGKIAFINRIGLDQWLYIMNADGSDMARVSTAPYAYEADPTWSPDYRSVVYIDYAATNTLKRYTLSNGRIEVVYQAPGSIAHPQVSPDGKKIAFDMQAADGNRDIYVVDADGTNLTRLTTNQYWDEHPTWSPDGQRIAFASWRSESQSKLFVMNRDGSDQHVIHHCAYVGLSGHCRSPAWSPAAGDERIAFASDSPGYTSLRLVNADGTGVTVVTSDATVDDKQPAWSRDATKLAFRSKIAGTAYPDIYSINTDGTGLRQLTPRVDALAPAWAR